MALAGTIEQADEIKPWIERKRIIGLDLVGVICPARH